MRRKGSLRVRDRSAPIEGWYGTSWLCECTYTNVGTDRCYFCGSRAPATLRAAMAPATDVPPR